MLRQRVITALIGAPLFIAALFLLPSAGLAVLFGAVIMIGAWEWGALSGLTGRGVRGAYVLVLMALGATGVVFAIAAPGSRYWIVVLIGVAVWWMWAAAEVIFSRQGGAWFNTATGKTLSGIMVLVPLWVSMILLHAADPQQPLALLYLVLLVWAADTFAYFAGHMFGRHKLAPAVSPGKTIEGVAGGILAVLVLTAVWAIWVADRAGAQRVAAFVLAVVVTLVSVIGDLVESKFKRLAGAKDSGAILPGHGGILDRVDALSAAAPLYALGWLLFLRKAA
jgi:phosphatidate cytidylyltransferase